MSQRFKVVGSLTFDSKSDYEDETEILEDTEVLGALARSVTWSKKTVQIRFDAEVAHDDAPLFADWVTSIAEVASEGSIDTWQEGLDDDSKYTHIQAGGESTDVAGAFPH